MQIFWVQIGPSAVPHFVEPCCILTLALLYLESWVMCYYPPYLCESVRQCSCCILSAEYCAAIHLTSVRVLGSAHVVSWVPSTVLLSTLPLWECEAVLMLYLECRVLRHYEGQCAAQPRQPQRHEADRCIRTCCHSFASFDNFAQWSCRPLGFTVRPGSALFWLPVGIWSQTVLCCSLLKASIIG